MTTPRAFATAVAATGLLAVILTACGSSGGPPQDVPHGKQAIVESTACDQSLTQAERWHDEMQARLQIFTREIQNLHSLSDVATLDTRLKADAAGRPDPNSIWAEYQRLAAQCRQS